jgi:RNA polymerase sigma factor, sigma-70 family
MDSESFKHRFLPLHQRLYRIAFAMTENANDAEDIVQDAYCKLWDRRDELDSVINAEAFCVTLVKNMCLDLLRSAKRNRREEDVTENLTLHSEESTDNGVIEQENMNMINSLIDELPENQRQVIRLRGIDECSMEEIELITGLSAVNIRVLLSRARKTIRTKYETLLSYGR